MCSHRIGGLGELERFILPPVTGRSASFRLRFRFVRVVRAVRAGEAKLRGRMTSDVPIAGPPGCWDGGVPALPLALFLVTVSSKRMVFLVFTEASSSFDAIYMGFKELLCFVGQYSTW